MIRPNIPVYELNRLTRADWMERITRSRLHPREVAREEFQQRRERGSRNDRNRAEADE